MMEALDEETLRGRRPVWASMSDLFLDTEVRWQLQFVARACASSPHELGQLDHIFWVEVFPLAIGNLLQVAGEWAMLVLDEPALVRRALYGKRRPLAAWLVGSLVEREWKTAGPNLRYRRLELSLWWPPPRPGRRLEPQHRPGRPPAPRSPRASTGLPPPRARSAPDLPPAVRHPCLLWRWIHWPPIRSNRSPESGGCLLRGHSGLRRR